jgi:NAD dependent epimerase/dehydratase family enzyme
MAKALGTALGRPAKLAVPAFVLRTMMGELADVLLGSQRALPARLMAAGFEFEFPDIDAALVDLIRS